MIFSYTASILALVVLVAAETGAAPNLESEPSRFTSRKPSPTLRAAEYRVRRLQAVNQCVASGSTSCRRLSKNALPRAVKALEKVAKRERKSLRLQKPGFRTYVIEPLVGPADATVLVLSGFGGQAADRVAEVTTMMRKGMLKRVRVIVPQAEPSFNTFFGTSDLPSWFDIPRSETSPWRTDLIFAAAGSVASLIDVTSTIFGTDRKRAGVFGESQGAALAITVSLRHYVSAVTAIVGFVPTPGSWPASMTTESARSPVLFITAGADRLIPKSVSKLSIQLLRALGRKVTTVQLKGRPHNLGNGRQKTLERGMRFVYDMIGILPGGGEPRDGVFGVDPVVWELL